MMRRTRTVLAVLLAALGGSACVAGTQSDEAVVKSVTVQLGFGSSIDDELTCTAAHCAVTFDVSVDGDRDADAYRVVLWTDDGPVGRVQASDNATAFTVPEGTFAYRIDRPEYKEEMQAEIEVSVSDAPPLPDSFEEGLCSDLMELDHPANDGGERYLGSYSDYDDTTFHVESAAHPNDVDRYGLAVRDDIDGGAPSVRVRLIQLDGAADGRITLSAGPDGYISADLPGALLLRGFYDRGGDEDMVQFEVFNYSGECVDYRLEITVT